MRQFSFRFKGELILRGSNDIEAKPKHRQRQKKKKLHSKLIKKKAKLHCNENGVVAVSKANFIFVHLFVVARTSATAMCTHTQTNKYGHKYT